MTTDDLEICKRIWPNVPWSIQKPDGFRITAEVQMGHNFTISFTVWKPQTRSNYCFTISSENADGTDGADMFRANHPDLAAILEAGRTEYLHIVEGMAGLAKQLAR